MGRFPRDRTSVRSEGGADRNPPFWTSYHHHHRRHHQGLCIASRQRSGGHGAQSGIPMDVAETRLGPFPAWAIRSPLFPLRNTVHRRNPQEARSGTDGGPWVVPVASSVVSRSSPVRVQMGGQKGKHTQVLRPSRSCLRKPGLLPWRFDPPFVCCLAKQGRRQLTAGAFRSGCAIADATPPPSKDSFLLPLLPCLFGSLLDCSGGTVLRRWLVRAGRAPFVLSIGFPGKGACPATRGGKP